MVLMWLSERYTGQEVADRFDTSRTTLYAWTARYRESGRAGLEDRPPIARSCPHKTEQAIEQQILEARRKHGWGPKKLRTKLMAKYPDQVWPQPSTMGEILERNGQIVRRRERRKTSTPFRRKYEPKAAGELTTVDFKGQFKTLDGVYCYPLTMMDLTSRYLLACHPLLSVAYEGVWPVYRSVFREHGMPLAIQSDNGIPFCHPNALARISRLSVKLMTLGIQPVINDPGHPEQNGAHERMHRTYAEEATRPPGKDCREQRKMSKGFKWNYNEERPHEALGQVVPASRYNGSPRAFPEKEPRVDYASHLEVRLVSTIGSIKFNDRSFFLGSALRHRHVGLEAVDDGIWSIQFGAYELGRLDERTGDIQ